MIFLKCFVAVAVLVGTSTASGQVVVSGTSPPMPTPEQMQQLTPAQREQVKKAMEAARKGQKPPQMPTAKPSGKKGKKDKKDEKKPGETDVVKRPTEPPKPADPKELKVRPNRDGLVEFNFKYQPWPAVLDWLSDISHKSIDWQEAPSGYLHLTTQRPYNIAQTFNEFNRLLLARGFTFLDHGDNMSLVNIKKLNPSLVPRVQPEDLKDPAKHQPYEFVKVSFALERLVAKAAVEELKPMSSPNGKLTPMEATNRIEAMDAVANLRDIQALLQQEQSGDGRRPRPWKYKVQHRRASELVKMLEALVGGASGGAAPKMDPKQMAQMHAMIQAAKQRGQKPPQMPTAKPGTKVRIVADDRTNMLYAYAPPNVLADIEEALETLDVPDRRSATVEAQWGGMRVYHLSSLSPEPLVKTLKEIGNLDLNTHLEIDKDSKAIIAYATLADHAKINMLIEKLDSTGRKFEVIPLRKLRADYVAGTVQHMFLGGQGKKKKKSREIGWWSRYYGDRQSEKEKGDRFMVDAETEHNLLLLWATDVEIEEVKKFLIKLGENPPEQGDRRTVRVLNALGEKETQKVLEQLRRMWPGKNPLLIDEKINEKTEEKEGKEEKEEKKSTPKPATDIQAHRWPMVPDGRIFDAGDTTGRPRMRLVQYQPEPAEKTSREESSTNRSDPRPIIITLNANGRLVISSEDTKALDELQELLGKLAPPHPPFKRFRLRHAWVFDVADILKDFFKEEADVDLEDVYWSGWYGDSVRTSGDDEGNRLSKRRPLRFIVDSASNSILVQGADAAQLKTIQELIDLYDCPQPMDSENVRQYGMFRLRYSKASTVASTIKDVYRDLLSANDKAFGGKKEERGRSDFYGYFWRRGSGDNKDEVEKAPRFKGSLSIGIDELSNTLIISAPIYIFKDVQKMVLKLDEAAKPAVSTLHVVKLTQGVDTSELQETLAKILSEPSAAGGAAAKKKPPGRKPKEGVSARRNR